MEMCTLLCILIANPIYPSPGQFGARIKYCRDITSTPTTKRNIIPVEMLFAVFTLLIVNSMASSVKPKRGFVANGASSSPASCKDPNLLYNMGWFYDYNAASKYYGMGCPNTPDPKYVPMSWCISSFNDSAPAGTNTTFWLAGNEPNNVHNCNKEPRVVAEAWRWLIARFEGTGTTIVSPATAGNGIDWYDQFFGNCSQLYGDEGCRIGMLATHDYSCTPDSTLSYLKQLHSRYGLPVWLTEFACGDHNAKRPLADQVAFMKAVVPLLDEADFVYRYAWMSGRQHEGDFRGLLTGNGTDA